MNGSGAVLTTLCTYTASRSVEIVGLDRRSDGGFRVATAREVGGLFVLGTHSEQSIDQQGNIVAAGGQASRCPLRTLSG